jgi:hypothetical protein
MIRIMLVSPEGWLAGSIDDLTYGGVYILFNNEECIYVGQSKNHPLGRILGHKKDYWWNEVTHYAYIRVLRDQLSETEREAIRVLDPKFNVLNSPRKFTARICENPACATEFKAYGQRRFCSTKCWQYYQATHSSVVWRTPAGLVRQQAEREYYTGIAQARQQAEREHYTAIAQARQAERE